MKTLLTSTIVALSISFGASAETEKSVKSSAIKAPAFTFGSPNDINHEELAALKNMRVLKAPAFVWGSPEDAHINKLTPLKIAAPAFEWGSPNEVFSF